MWRIFYNYIIFRMLYFGDKIFLNHVADFLQLHLQKVLFWWQDLSQSCGGFLQLHHLQNVVFWWQNPSQSCGGFSTATSSSRGSILVTRSFSIMWQIFYSYIFFRMFYFGDKQVIHHFGNWLSYLLQEVLFWWQDLSQSYGGFSAATSSSECSILVTSKLSTILGINQVIHHFRNLEWVIHHFGNLSKGYPPV